ncbi:MAG: PqqD family protein [Myxococcota bacterium]
MTSDGSVVFQKNPDTATRDIAGETFIVPIKGDVASMDRMYVLDAVGVLLWNSIDGERSVDEIVALVTDTFDVDAHTARTDAVEFLSGLVAEKLVWRAKGST